MMMWCPLTGWLRFDGRRWTSPGAPIVTPGAVRAVPRIAVGGVFLPAGMVIAGPANDRWSDGAA